MAAISITANAIKVGKVRAAITICAGPWVPGVRQDMIKIRAKKFAFPAEIRAAFAVTNSSDSREDYFEADSIRLFPGHPLYDAAKAAAE
jgi:hypothetical protein